MAKKRVLFLCTGNSCRSQMAEGLLRAKAGDRFEVHSAGTRPSTVHPLAIEAMAAIGISRHRSKSALQYVGQLFGHVITVCDYAAEMCPTFPGRVERLHWPFEDPAEATGSLESVRATFARIRDQIARAIDAWCREPQETQP